MLLQLAQRLAWETNPRLLAKFAYNCGWKGMRAVNAFRRRGNTGPLFPAFLFLSVTNRCNLRCQGCWVTVTGPPRQIEFATLDRVILESKRQGSYFFGLLGGEPLLYPRLFELIARHRDCYFQVFTNGTFLTDDIARAMREVGNVTPLISIEGREQVGDERRGGAGIYPRVLESLAHCRRHRLITGVATSVCRSNIDELAAEPFVRELIRCGVHYLWYYIYRPVGGMPVPELALSEEQIVRLRRFMVEGRTQWPILLVDAYWDHEGRALCPAAVGISHHINPSGDIEPCPVIQFARENIGDGRDLAARLIQSQFLERFRELARHTTRGCILLDQPGILRDFLLRENARDTSGRETGFDELKAMVPRAGHHLPGREIPERHWFYRFAKKHWFFGFGAYG